MAARIRRTELHEAWREKIQASMLINRLVNHALGEVEMTSTQVRAADILLKKVMPDLSSTELDAIVDGEVAIRRVNVRGVGTGASNA